MQYAAIIVKILTVIENRQKKQEELEEELEENIQTSYEDDESASQEIEGPNATRIKMPGAESYILLYELRNKISLGFALLHELARQLIEGGIIEPVGFIQHSNHPTTYWVGIKDKTKIEKMEFFTLFDLSIKFNTTIALLRKMIASGKLKPDFTLQVEGEEKEYIFLEIPKKAKYRSPKIV